jgi:hypothetical protein
MTDPRSPLGPGGSHPEEALAAFTDGTASPDERALVLQHLQACAECRREVELARAALAALSTLPEPASPRLDPEDIVRRAGIVVGMDRGRRTDDPRRRFGALAGGLAAAAVVAVLFAGVIKLNQGDSASTAAGGRAVPAAGPKAPEGNPSNAFDAALGAVSIDYTPSSIDRLAADEAAAIGKDGGAHAPDAPGAAVTAQLALRATSCASKTADVARAVRILVAKFQGRPAFVTVLRQGIGDQEAVRVVVTDRSNCAVLYTTSHPVAG